jgi:pilus assembly protein CpaE
MFRVYLIEDDIQFTEKFIAETVRSDLVRIVGHAAAVHGAHTDIRETRPHAIVVGLKDTESALKATAELSAAFSEYRIIFAVQPERYGIEAYRLARKSGAENVIRKPYRVQDLLNAIESTIGIQPPDPVYQPDEPRQEQREAIAPVRQQERLSGKVVLRQEVVAVYSPKGGVGKSTISAAIALALKKVRNPNLSVCVVDLDTNFISLPTLFCTKPEICIDAWQKYGADDIDYPLAESLLTKHESGIYLLSAPEVPSVIPGLETEKIIRVLTKYFDVVIIDCGISVHQDSVMTALDLATKILLVTTPDVPSIKKVADFVPMLQKLRINQSKIRLVINMLKNDSIPVREIHAAIASLPLAGTIPDEPKLAKMIYDRQVPYSLQDTAYNNAIRRLANTIVPVFGSAGHGGSFKQGFPFFNKWRRKRNNSKRPNLDSALSYH